MNPPARARMVRCPHCRQPAPYTADNPARPFCSMRCRSIDLGAWAAEGYRMAEPAGDNVALPADPPGEPRH